MWCSSSLHFLSFTSFQKLRSRPSPPVASVHLLLAGCSRHRVQADSRRVTEKRRKIARPFFMGRILTAVVGRSSLVVGLPLFDVTPRNLRCSVVCQKPTTTDRRLARPLLAMFPR